MCAHAFVQARSALDRHHGQLPLEERVRPIRRAERSLPRNPLRAPGPLAADRWKSAICASSAFAGTCIFLLKRTSAFENGFGIMSASQVLSIQASLDGDIECRPSATPLARESSTGPGLATYFGPRGPSIVNATRLPCSNWFFRPSKPCAPPRLLGSSDRHEPEFFDGARDVFAVEAAADHDGDANAFSRATPLANTARCQKE